MFPPPPPRAGLLTPVPPPYSADVTQKKLWESKQQRHRDALAAVPKLTDQSDPAVATASLQRARGKARSFASDVVKRQIGEENKMLLGKLCDIVQKPGATVQMIKAEPPKIARRPQQYEKKRAVALENEALVRRLMSVKGTYSRERNEKDYKRHQRDVFRMQKMALPDSRRQLRRQGSAPTIPHRLPPLHPIQEAAVETTAEASSSSTATVQSSVGASPLLLWQAQGLSPSYSAPSLQKLASASSTPASALTPLVLPAAVNSHEDADVAASRPASAEYSPSNTTPTSAGLARHVVDGVCQRAKVRAVEMAEDEADTCQACLASCLDPVNGCHHLRCPNHPANLRRAEIEKLRGEAYEELTKAAREGSLFAALGITDADLDDEERRTLSDDAIVTQQVETERPWWSQGG